MTQIGCCGKPQQPKFYASRMYSLVGSGSPSPCAMDSLYEFFNKTLKSVLLGRRIAASGHCR